MSRRRCTTAKMFSGNKQRGPKRPSQSRLGATDSVDRPGHQDETTDARVSAETLSRHLAEQALLRDSSEERMATVMKRYFRLSLAVAGINALVAVTTMVALWSRPGRAPQPPPVPNTTGAAPIKSPIPPLPIFPPAPAAPAPSLAPSPVSPEAASSALPSAKGEDPGAEPGPRRRMAKVRPRSQTGLSEDMQGRAYESKSLALDSVVERW